MTTLVNKLPGGGETAQQIARGLGWFSICLGAAELLAPRAMSRASGLPRRSGLLATYGLREIATGIGILAARDPMPWIWSRVGGDMLDAATLAAGMGDRRSANGRIGLSLAVVAGVTALDFVCAIALGEHRWASRRFVPDYSSRSGFPKGVQAARGAARDFTAPHNMRTPEALRPLAHA